MSFDGPPAPEPSEPVGEYPTTPYPVPPPVPPVAPPPAPPVGASYPPPAGPPVAPAPLPGGAYAPSGYPAPPALPSTSNNAIVALVLAILSFAVCPLVLSIAALIVSKSATREIDASNGWVGGGGLVTAAKVIAWINIGLFIVAVVLLLVFLVVIAPTQNTSVIGA